MWDSSVLVVLYEGPPRKNCQDDRAARLRCTDQNSRTSKTLPSRNLLPHLVCSLLRKHLQCCLELGTGVLRPARPWSAVAHWEITEFNGRSKLWLKHNFLARQETSPAAVGLRSRDPLDRVFGRSLLAWLQVRLTRQLSRLQPLYPRSVVDYKGWSWFGNSSSAVHLAELPEFRN